MNTDRNIPCAGNRTDESILESSMDGPHDTQKSFKIPGFLSKTACTHHGGQDRHTNKASCATLKASSSHFEHKPRRAGIRFRGYLVSLLFIGLFCESVALRSLHHMVSASASKLSRSYSPDKNAASHGTKHYCFSPNHERLWHDRQMRSSKYDTQMRAADASKQSQVLFHVAPMQCYTNRFFRALIRQMSDKAVLW
jgi:hypothetical protein